MKRLYFKKMGILSGIMLLVINISAIIIFPILTIVSLNILFGLDIDINLETWLATFWLTLLLRVKEVIHAILGNR